MAEKISLVKYSPSKMPGFEVWTIDTCEQWPDCELQAVEDMVVVGPVGNRFGIFFLQQGLHAFRFVFECGRL